MITDTQTGFRAIRKDALDKLELSSQGMELASEMILEAKLKGLTIGEIPVDYYRRRGQSKLRTFRDGMRHLIFITKWGIKQEIRIRRERKIIKLMNKLNYVVVWNK